MVATRPLSMGRDPSEHELDEVVHRDNGLWAYDPEPGFSTEI